MIIHHLGWTWTRLLFKPSDSCKQLDFFFEANTSARKSVPGSEEDKIKEKSSLLLKPTTETTNCFLNYFGSLRDAPTTFLDGGTRELVLLMSLVVERILYPPELKVTSGTTHCSTVIRSAPEMHFPPEVWFHAIIQSRHLLITKGLQLNEAPVSTCETNMVLKDTTLKSV